jgi:hypothetical protein
MLWINVRCYPRISLGWLGEATRTPSPWRPIFGSAFQAVNYQPQPSVTNLTEMFRELEEMKDVQERMWNEAKGRKEDQNRRYLTGPSLWAVMVPLFKILLRVKWGNQRIYWARMNLYTFDSPASRNDVSVSDGRHIRQWSHNIIILYYNTYCCVTVAYSIQYSNMLYRFVA